MSIQINPVDFRGFAIGSAAVPQLPNIGALGLQAITSQQDRAAQERMNMARIRSSDEAMLRQNALERDKLNQQNAQFQQSLGLDKRKVGLLDTQNQREIGLKDKQLGQELDLNNRKIDLATVEQQYNQWKEQQKLAQEALKLETVQLANKKKEEIDTMGAFATQARIAMDGVQSPQDARTLQLSILDEAAKNGYISKQAAEQMRQMPVSSFKSALEFKIVQLDKVKDYQAMSPKKQGAGGNIEIVGADGTVVKMQGLNTPVENKLQQDVLDKEKGLNQFEKIAKGYDPEYFTYANQSGAKLAKEAEKSKGIPGLQQGTEMLAGLVTGKTKKEQEEFLGKRKAYMNSVEQLFNAYKKEITGAAAGEKEIEQIRNSFINGDLSPSEFKGALDQVVEKYKSESTADKKALSSGLDVQPTRILKYNPATGRLE